MNRRKFVSYLMALPFVALFGKFAKAEKLRMNPSYYGETIPVIHGNAEKFLDKPGVMFYAYTWKSTADGPVDFRTFISSDGVFTLPPDCAGQSLWIPALMTDDATQWPKDAPRAIRSSK